MDIVVRPYCYSDREVLDLMSKQNSPSCREGGDPYRRITGDGSCRYVDVAESDHVIVGMVRVVHYPAMGLLKLEQYGYQNDITAENRIKVLCSLVQHIREEFIGSQLSIFPTRTRLSRGEIQGLQEVGGLVQQGLVFPLGLRVVRVED